MKWYSICSAHQKRRPDCENCNIGNWVDESDPEWIADQALWESDPDAWREKHNEEVLKLGEYQK